MFNLGDVATKAVDIGRRSAPREGLPTPELRLIKYGVTRCVRKQMRRAS
jgi:hypothetical protein